LSKLQEFKSTQKKQYIQIPFFSAMLVLHLFAARFAVREIKLTFRKKYKIEKKVDEE